MSRRPAGAYRRFTDGGSIPIVGSLHPKSRPSPSLSIGLVVLGAFLIIGYLYSGSDDVRTRFFGRSLLNDVCDVSGGMSADREALLKSKGGASCSLEVLRAIPILKKSYGDGMRKVLHVGPETCLVVSKLIKEGDTEAWGVEPYDLDDADANCKTLVHKGVVRVADIKFSLPYRTNSFSLVIVSDALDYLSPKYLNKTLPELARISSGGLLVFSGYPGHQHGANVAELSKFGRPAKLRSASWWIRYFVQTSLPENEPVLKKFEKAAAESSYTPACQIFHLKPQK